MQKRYSVKKEKNNNCNVTILPGNSNSFRVNPKNQVEYDGITVNQLTLINQSFIEKVLKKKIKRKLDSYLNLIIQTLDESNDETGESFRHALNDLSRYRDIVEYKYQKYLDQKYIALLLQKIAILEYELKQKLIYIAEPEEKSHGGRGR